MSAHLATGLGATAADFGAFCIAHLVARLGAGFAYFRASSASHVMQLGMAEHEIMCGVAHFRAVQEESDVFRIGVLAPFL
ncbi:MAG TPA: hypothetical protein VJT50_11275 [Pyrinomonadaceae bacterium]|jgi:hypothetical protein|nr:hypothetical protein [Pyrinomonadaceae bacterium]